MPTSTTACTSRRRPSSFETYQAKHNKRRRLSVLGSTSASTTTTSSSSSNNVSPTKKARKSVRFTTATLNSSAASLNLQYHEIPSRHSLTQEELDLLWYKKSQLKSLRQTAIALVRQWEQQQAAALELNSGSSDSDWSDSDSATSTTTTTSSSSSEEDTTQTNSFKTTQVCWRGLEKRTRQGAKEYRATRQKGIRTVLLEQARQRSLSIFQAHASAPHTVDPQWLAQVYIRVSATSKMGAQQRGIQDAQEASRIYWTLFGETLTAAKVVVAAASGACGVVRASATTIQATTAVATSAQ